MPELPEVETVCRGLAPVMTGQRIASVELHRAGLRDPFPAGMAKTLTGARVTAVSRRAKYILIHLDTGKMLVLHLGMSGRVLVQDAPHRALKHDHLVLNLANDRAIVLNDPRRFGTAFIADEEDWESHKAFKTLGPEPLSRGFTGPVLAAALRNKKSPLKVALMDQRVVVGVGNIYASEALFMAGISPLRAAGSVRADRVAELVRCIRAVLNKSIRAGGSSLRDYRRADGELGYFQHHFAVYGRAGQACPGCTCDINKTGGIRCVTQAGRSTFYCPRKQK